MDNFFAKIGKAITDSGTDNFVAGIHSLINDYVRVDVTEATNWVLDDKNKTVTAVHRLGAWGEEAERLSLGRSGVQSRDDMPESSVFGKIVNAEDSQLIHLKPRSVSGDIVGDSSDTIYRCILIYHQENQRNVISLYRSAQPHDFTLQELSALKQLSDVILPAVSHHARKRTRAPRREVPVVAAAPVPTENQASHLQRSFDDRLNRMGVVLSSREYQVCLAHLFGNTLPAIARQLSVRESTAATYFRRAGIKLNLSGRHGFAKWMLGTVPG